MSRKHIQADTNITVNVVGNVGVPDWSALASGNNPNGNLIMDNRSVVLVWRDSKCIECTCPAQRHLMYMPTLTMYCPKCPGRRLRAIDPMDGSDQITDLTMPFLFYDCRPGMKRWATTGYQFELSSPDVPGVTLFRGWKTWNTAFENKIKNLPYISPRRHNLAKAILYADQLGECSGCGKKFPLDGMTVDHTRPTDKGGARVFGNMTAMCPSCNGKKGNRL